MCFAVYRGDIQSRFDVQYFVADPSLPGGQNFSTAFPTVLLSDISKRIIQPNEFTREYVDESGDSVALLRAANVLDGELNTEDLIFVDKEVLNLARDGYSDSYIQKGDVLITRTGAKAGATCVVRDLNRPFIISSHSIRIIPKLELVEPNYLELFLLSRWGKAQINRLFTGAAQKQLQLATISKLVVSLPPLEIQRALVAQMDTARRAYQTKLTQADELLSSLDAYLLAQLGLAPPAEDKRLTYAVSLNQLRTDKRLNADYFHPERILAVREQQTRKGLRSERLSDIVHFIRDTVTADSSENYVGLANVQSHTGEIVESSDERAEGQCFAFIKNDVLFGRLRPYLNKVYRAERGGVCSTEFHVMRLRKPQNSNDEIMPDYLATILRSSLILAQTKHMMTGNTHPRLANEDVSNLVVPLPKLNMQQAIAAEVQRRRVQARKLREEAAREWALAKARFERKLLGEAV